jgi:hypothetical protein
MPVQYRKRAAAVTVRTNRFTYTAQWQGGNHISDLDRVSTPQLRVLRFSFRAGREIDQPGGVQDLLQRWQDATWAAPEHR